jgi:hypothetical protein
MQPWALSVSCLCLSLFLSFSLKERAPFSQPERREARGERRERQREAEVLVCEWAGWGGFGGGVWPACSCVSVFHGVYVCTHQINETGDTEAQGSGVWAVQATVESRLSPVGRYLFSQESQGGDRKVWLPVGLRGGD